MFTVSTRRASGINSEDAFATEFEGIRALRLALEGHGQSGNIVAQQQPSYIYPMPPGISLNVQN